MIASKCKFEALGKRDSFNSFVRHIKSTISLLDEMDSGKNLADNINFLIDDKAIQSDDLLPVVSMLLKDKYGYHSFSRNLVSTTDEIAAICTEVSKWNAVDIIAVYHHPDLGIIVLNPKNPDHMTRLDRLNRFELLTLYIGGFTKTIDEKLAAKASKNLVNLFEGKTAAKDESLLKGSFSYKPPKLEKAKAPPAQKAKRGPKPKQAPKSTAAKAAAPVAAPQAEARAETPAAASAAPRPGMRMTPMYAVLVRNELFHNGNVEAWKKIIESYRTKHPNLTVLVYYDGERITDLNALFKWGKVKHGNVIQFAVAGEDIRDVAKLQRYLAQGASPMFEAFLRGPVNSVLPLF